MSNKKRGFSLMEVILSIVVLETIAVGMLGMMAFGTRAGLMHEETQTVINLLQWKVEEVKSRPYSVNVAEAGTWYPGYNRYSFTVNQTLNYASNPQLKRVQVSVTWSNFLGVIKVESVWFLVANT